MFKIGDFSRITNLTIRALHHYEELGLLQPAKVDASSNYRYYSAQQLETVNQIKLLQQAGFSLKVIKEMIAVENVARLEKYYQLREAEIQSELQALNKKQRALELYRKKGDNGLSLNNYSVELKEIPSRKVMSLRMHIDNFEGEGQVWQALHQEFIKQKVKMANPPMGMTIYHDREYKDYDIDIEVQSDILGDYTDTEKVKFFETKPLQIVSVTFSGSYAQMPAVTQALANWLAGSDYQINGPMINIPYVSPAQDPNPDNWVTEAGYVIKAK